MIERIGVNLDDFNVPDNAGNMRKDEKIVEDGPDAYSRHCRAGEIAEKIVAAGDPCRPVRKLPVHTYATM